MHLFSTLYLLIVAGFPGACCCLLLPENEGQLSIYADHQGTEGVHNSALSLNEMNKLFVKDQLIL